MSTEKKYIPLIFEQSKLRVFSRDDRSGSLNLGARIDLRDDVDEETFLRAMRIGVERLPYMSYRLHETEDGTFVQYRSDEAPEGMDRAVDMSGYTDKRVGKLLSDWTSEPFPDRLMDTRLYRMKLIRLSGDRLVFFICTHHYIADIYAIIYALTYIDRVYSALADGTALPPAAPDPEETVYKVNARFSSARYEKNVEWCRRSITPEPVFTSVNGRNSPEFVKGKNYGKGLGLLQHRSAVISCGMPDTLQERLYACARERNISPQVFFLAAIDCFLGGVSGSDDVTVGLQHNSRLTLTEKSTGLSRGKGIMFRARLDGNESFESMLRRFDLMQKEYYRYGDISWEDLFAREYPIGQDMLYYSTQISYVPFVDYSSLRTCKCASAIDSGLSIMPLYIIIMPEDASGRLGFTYKYARGYVKAGNVRRLHAFMLKFLEAGLNAPEKTVAQLREECGGLKVHP